MQFMIILQKVFVFEANANGINIAKNIKILFEIRKTKRSSKHNKETYC